MCVLRLPLLVPCVRSTFVLGRHLTHWNALLSPFCSIRLNQPLNLTSEGAVGVSGVEGVADVEGVAEEEGVAGAEAS